MKRSTDRILTTHIGSLPRPEDWIAILEAVAAGDAAGIKAYNTEVKGRIAEIVRRQAACGLDVVTDGEWGKPSFLTYINDRLGGYEPNLDRKAASPWNKSREGLAFPEFYASQSPPAGDLTPSAALRIVCTGPVTYKGRAQLDGDIANLKAAIEGVGVTEAFMPAISPGNIENWEENRYYDTDEEYLFAIADAMHEEYKAIADAGLILQIDDPRLVTYYVVEPDLSIDEVRKWAEIRVEALNHALRGIAEEQIRFHTCYSINIGPRVHDMELKDIVDIILKVNAGAYSFEAANPRHEHEWKLWEDVKLPDGKILIPGFITHSGVLVEHPEVVAQRIERYAGVVGRENIIAGADCGFATFAGSREIDTAIVWAKMDALVEGAKIASARLWG
ncbi:MAG: cobalamin-independent methionine synthase II family protein [Rhodospirillales bacterium]|nr:cobalamin-independent methionine synthase II family protein [Rhodospirillales bacterium]